MGVVNYPPGYRPATYLLLLDQSIKNTASHARPNCL